MKNIFLIIVVFTLFLNTNAQNLMKIDNEYITLDEFKSTLLKNNDDLEITKDYLDEYIDLFINYKLKVIEAKSLSLDKKESFIIEMNGYEKQLAKPYLQAADFKENLIKEAYERMQFDIHASHILFPFKINDNNIEDTLSAYKLAFQAKNEISSGRLTFDQAVTKYHNLNDYGSSDLGYFTAFRMVYNFESAAYNTKVGDVSDIVRTKFGYHLIKVHDKQPAAGEVKVSHIMFKLQKGASDNQISKVKLKIDEVFNKLEEGFPFSELADQFSEDRSTAVKGGSVPWFGRSKVEKAFEDASFSLENIGDYSYPFLTNYGWHIVKLDDRRHIKSYELEYEKIKKLIEKKGERNTLSENALLNRIKKEYNFRENILISCINTHLEELIDPNDLILGNLQVDDLHVNDNDIISILFKNPILFWIERKGYNQDMFKSFILDNQDEGLSFDQLYNRFVDFSCLEHEESQLEVKHPEYKRLLNEFRDGILLFDLTSQKVWKKAMSDTIGLKNFFNSRSQSYMWGDRVKANIYICSNQDVLYELRSLLSNRSDLLSIDSIKEIINLVSPLNLTVTEGIYEKGDNNFIDQVNWKKGLTEVSTNSDKVILVEILDIFNSEPKLFEETKGKVISDYQQYLEKEWVNELREKYDFDVDLDVLYSILK